MYAGTADHHCFLLAVFQAAGPVFPHGLGRGEADRHAAVHCGAAHAGAVPDLRRRPAADDPPGPDRTGLWHRESLHLSKRGVAICNTP